MTNKSGDERPFWLVVEDDEGVREFVATCFDLWGYEPLSFANGYEAMKWLDRVEQGETDQLPQLALLDIRMPGPKGHDIGKRLRSIPSTADIPIIIMTAFRATSEERDEIYSAADPEGFITKPLPSPGELMAYLEAFIKEKAGEKSGSEDELPSPQKVEVQVPSEEEPAEKKTDEEVGIKEVPTSSERPSAQKTPDDKLDKKKVDVKSDIEDVSVSEVDKKSTQTPPEWLRTLQASVDKPDEKKVDEEKDVEELLTSQEDEKSTPAPPEWLRALKASVEKKVDEKSSIEGVSSSSEDQNSTQKTINDKSGEKKVDVKTDNNSEHPSSKKTDTQEPAKKPSDKDSTNGT